ncbi:MAG: TonB-dependent receptor [Pseudomonadota bacterium]
MQSSKTTVTIRTGCLLTALLLGTAYQAYAQYQENEGETANNVVLDAIIVTGEKRDRNLQDVPSSISVVTDEELELLPGRSLADATTLVPNVIIQNQGGRTGTYFYTRGIGRSELNFPIVSVNVNGVALPDPSFFGLDLDAAAQVEFLRGPQGTLYGQNTLGGVINISLKEPSDEFAGSADFLIGERGYRESAVRLEGPIWGDKLKAAGTFFWNDIDGFIQNTTTGEPQNNERGIGGSLFVLANPTDALEIEFNYFAQDRSDGLAQFPQPDDLFTITNDAPTEEDTLSHILGLTVSYDFGNVLLESQTGFSKIDRFTQNDLDFTPFPLTTATADSDIDQWSQEIRLVSENEGPFNYIFGLYALGLSNDFDVFFNDFADIFMTGLPSQVNDLVAFEDTTLAAFGQLNYVWNRWEFIAGLRYQYEEIRTDNLNSVFALPSAPGSAPLFPPTSINEEDDFSELLPRFAATYEVSDDLKLYGSISRGFRAGGFNATALTAELLGITGIPTSFGPEFTWNYELGAKWQLPNGLGRIDAAAFYIDWSDLQADQIAPGSLIDFRTNSASATSVGFEVEARLFPADDWELGATFGYADAEYDEFVELFTGFDFSGNQVAGGAEITWSTFIRYDNDDLFGPVGLRANVSANGVNGRFFDVANLLPGDDYGLVNARLGLTYQNIEVFAFARNAFDDVFIEFEFPGFGAFPSEPQLFGGGIEVSW